VTEGKTSKSGESQRVGSGENTKQEKDKGSSKVFGMMEVIHSVVATTRQNGTCDMLTSAKLSVGYLVVGIIRELDKEPSLHCYPIYISYRWSMLQQCVYLMSTLQ